MPRTPIDYSKTIIYKIQHIEDENLLYIGHTTEFTKRKSSHKRYTNAEGYKEYQRLVYKMIRDNGNWEMFNMIEIKKFACNNRREAEAEEDRIMRELKATMNMNRAFLTSEEVKVYKKEWKEEHKDEVKKQAQEYRDKLNMDESGKFSIDAYCEKLRKQKIYRDAYKKRQSEKQ